MVHFPSSFLVPLSFFFADGATFICQRVCSNKKGAATDGTDHFDQEEATAVLWGLALNEPEDTRGELRVQIRACEMMYRTLGFEPALQRLSEIANIDAVRTQGRRRDQEAAARLLKHLVSSIKVQRIH